MSKQRLIGQKIRAVRKRAGITQKELGEKIGYSAMAVSYFEQGLRKIKEKDIKAIAKALNIDTSYLLEPESSTTEFDISYCRIADDLNENLKRELDEAISKFEDYIKSEFPSIDKND